MEQRTHEVVPSPDPADTDSRPAKPGSRIRTSRRGSRPVSEDEQLAGASMGQGRAAGQGIAGSSMQITGVTQLSTQPQIPARPLQPRSKRLGVEDAAMGVARPARHGGGGRRLCRGSSHAGREGSPRSCSSARLSLPSQGVIVVIIPLGAGHWSCAGSGREGLFEEAATSSDFAPNSLVAARWGTASGRGGGLVRAGCRDRGRPADRRGTLDDRDDPLRPSQAGTVVDRLARHDDICFPCPSEYRCPDRFVLSLDAML